MKLTAGQVRALEAIEKEEPIRPRQFARAMWPESEGWRRYSRCGNNGVARGGGMCLAAGGYLGKLVQLGLVAQQFRGQLHDKDGYVLSGEGREALKKAREDLTKVRVKG